MADKGKNTQRTQRKTGLRIFDLLIPTHLHLIIYKARASRYSPFSKHLEHPLPVRCDDAQEFQSLIVRFDEWELAALRHIPERLGA